MTLHLPTRIEHLPVEDLLPYARNSRTHSDSQVAQIAASIREFGFTNPVLVRDDGTIVAGHGRVMAARQLGLERAPCIRMSHLTEAQARAYVIADNQLALNAGWDEEILASELRALMEDGCDGELLGFADADIGDLFARVDFVLDPERDPEAVPSAPEAPVSRPGDAWKLGAHRVICGDATSVKAYQVLLGDERADVVWTDPPYNVAYEGKAGAIQNDDMGDAEFLDFLRTVFSNIALYLRQGGCAYVSHADTGECGISFRRAFMDAGFHLAQCIVWRKDSMVLGRSDYQWVHEPILYGWLKGAGHKFYGGRKQTTVSEAGSFGSPFIKRPDGRWQITIGEETLIVSGEASIEWVEHSLMREIRPKRSNVHPTMKPVALIERMLRNSAKPGAKVLDAFGGSGSTLIAAERLGMSARMIELSPTFVDVIVRRWQEFTGGGQAILEGDGRSFDQIAAEGR